MKIEILHDDKIISSIAQEVANKKFAGMGGLTGTIYEEFGIEISKEYANLLFKVNFKDIAVFLKLAVIQCDKELMGLFLFKEYLNQIVSGLGSFNQVSEMVMIFKNSIDKHFEQIGKEKTIEIQNLISDYIKNNLLNHYPISHDYF